MSAYMKVSMYEHKGRLRSGRAPLVPRTERAAQSVHPIISWRSRGRRPVRFMSWHESGEEVFVHASTKAQQELW